MVHSVHVQQHRRGWVDSVSHVWLFLVGAEMIATFDMCTCTCMVVLVCAYLCFLCVPLVFTSGNISSIYRLGRWFSYMFCVLGMFFIRICVDMYISILYIELHTHMSVYTDIGVQLAFAKETARSAL